MSHLYREHMNTVGEARRMLPSEEAQENDMDYETRPIHHHSANHNTNARNDREEEEGALQPAPYYSPESYETSTLQPYYAMNNHQNETTTLLPPPPSADEPLYFTASSASNNTHYYLPNNEARHTMQVDEVSFSDAETQRVSSSSSGNNYTHSSPSSSRPSYLSGSHYSSSSRGNPSSQSGTGSSYLQNSRETETIFEIHVDDADDDSNDSHQHHQDGDSSNHLHYHGNNESDNHTVHTNITSSDSEEEYVHDNIEYNNSNIDADDASTKQSTMDDDDDDTVGRRKYCLIAAILGCFVFFLAIIGIIVSSVLLKQDQDIDFNSKDDFTSISFTLAPTAATRIMDFNAWIESNLPPYTVSAILQNNNSNNNNNNEQDEWMTPQQQAFVWIQWDPYFTTVNASIVADDQQRIQRFALATFYYATKGSVWGGHTRWMSHHEECSWPYYACITTIVRTRQASPTPPKRRRHLQVAKPRNNTVSKVTTTSLQLHDMPVSGTLPNEVGLLSTLSVLQISDTDLRGSIPSHMGLLTLLEKLNLSYNHLQGAVPSELGLLSQLTLLQLHGNHLLTGTMPVEVCNNLLYSYVSLQEIDIDCQAVECTCGCTCFNNQHEDNQNNSNNIFYHATDNTAIPTGKPSMVSLAPMDASTLAPTMNATTVSTMFSTSSMSATDNEVVTLHPTLVQTTMDSSLVTPAPSVNVASIHELPTTTTSAPTLIQAADEGSHTTTVMNSAAPSLLSDGQIITTTAPSASGESIIPDLDTGTFVPEHVDNESGSGSGSLLCNGLSNLCDIRLSRILFPMVHNAMATQEDGFNFPNHELSVERAVEAGYRGISLDLCQCGGKLVFCHKLCLLGTRDPQELMGNLHQFLIDNPREVLVITLEINWEDFPEIDLFELDAIFQDEIEGFQDLMYVHNPNNAWPTLGEFIKEDKRMILFHYNGPTCNTPGSCPLGYHYYFDYVADTAFEFQSVNDIEDSEESCRITRGSQGKHRAFFGVNNFLQLPVITFADTLNRFDFVKSRVEACSTINGGLDISFLYVDFWSVGDVLEYAMEYNLNLAPEELAI